MLLLPLASFLYFSIAECNALRGMLSVPVLPFSVSEASRLTASIAEKIDNDDEDEDD
jgi:hypothetical protein